MTLDRCEDWEGTNKIAAWGKNGANKLNLTAEQQAKIEQLRASARSQMDAVFTPAQQQAKARQELRQARGNT